MSAHPIEAARPVAGKSPWPAPGAWLGRAALLAAAALLVLSSGRPWWSMRLLAPQYPKGLTLVVRLDRVEGDVSELDTLNHYIGMKSLAHAAEFDRRIAIPGLFAVLLSLAAGAFLPRRWALLLAVPAVVLPIAFAGRLHWIMTDYGMNLDPHAPLSNSVDPFVPPLSGESKIANFTVQSDFGDGFRLAAIGSLAALGGLYLVFSSRRAPALAAAGLLLLTARPASAEEWVVGPGGDGRGLAEAVAAASPGDTIVVRGGVHPGPLVVDKPLVLAGEDGAVVDGGGRGTVVVLSAEGIVFRGFTVRGSGTRLDTEDAGILVSAPGVRIEDNGLEEVLFGVCVEKAPRSVLSGNRIRCLPLEVARRGDPLKVWYSDEVELRGNRIEGGRDAVLWFSSRMVVEDNEIRGGRYGLHFMYCHESTVERNRLTENSVGVFLMYSTRLLLSANRIDANRGPSGYGIGLKDMEGARIERNLVASNRAGIFIDGSTATLEGNLVAANDVGVYVVASARGNRFTGNGFTDNREAVVFSCAAPADARGEWDGNYWSDYRGYDADGDGVGDTPFRCQDLFEDLTGRNPSLRLFSGSVASAAIDHASRLFPIFAPRPRLIDVAPRMTPPRPPIAPEARPYPWAWAGSSAAMAILPLGFLAAIGVLVPVRRRRPLAAPAAARAAAIEVTGLTKRYGRFAALSDLSFEVRPGETVVLWGPNGAGKTTVLRSILGVLPHEGKILVEGLDPASRGRAVRALVGFVPQEIRLHTDLTVEETVRFYGRLRGVPRGRGRELLEAWHLADAAGRRVGDLSGGMRQKLALVIALLSDPPILLLDEPTSNLDPGARREFADLLERLRRAGKTLLFCSHRAEEVWRLADRVVVIEAGRKTAEGAPEEVLGPRDGLVDVSFVLRDTDVAPARTLLERTGWPVRIEAGRLTATVDGPRKIEPLRALLEEGFEILDFELGGRRPR